jgi:hypothetical protein
MNIAALCTGVVMAGDIPNINLIFQTSIFFEIYLLPLLFCVIIATMLSCGFQYSFYVLTPTPVLGTEDDNGNFLVEDFGFCSAGIPPPPPAHQLTGQLLFVSGLRLGGSGSDACANLLLEWLAGFCGSGSRGISACVLLGNGCAFRLSMPLTANFLSELMFKNFRQCHFFCSVMSLLVKMLAISASGMHQNSIFEVFSCHFLRF